MGWILSSGILYFYKDARKHKCVAYIVALWCQSLSAFGI